MEIKNAHVIIPLSVLQEIDRIAGKRMRSRFLTEAAKERIKRLKLEQALQSAAGAWNDADHEDIATKGSAQWVADRRREDEQRFKRVAK
ncbi:MAG TPA: hypothetical protein VGA53_04355 [Candidatus Paceibacterota bacterium]